MKQTSADVQRDREGDGEIGRAINDHTERIESNPNDALAYFARGTAHHKAFDFDSAIADLNKVLDLNPYCAAAYNSRGRAYYEKALHHCDRAQLDHAIADFTKAIAINPNSAPAYCNLGWTYEEIGEEQKAVDCYRKALEIDPSLEAARDNLKLLGTNASFSPAKAKNGKGS